MFKKIIFTALLIFIIGCSQSEIKKLDITPNAIAIKGINEQNLSEPEQIIGNLYESLASGYNITRTLKWNYFEEWETVIKINYHLYDYYKSLPRPGYEDYSFGVNYEPVNELVDDILLKSNKTYDSLYMALSLIQQFPNASYSYDDYPKLPVETLAEERSDSEDISILASSIIETLGYDAVLFKFPEHVSVGIWCENCSGDYFNFQGRNYFYFETTDELQLGLIPEDLLNKQVKVIQVNGQSNKTADLEDVKVKMKFVID